MSITVTKRVWASSKTVIASHRLMLLAIADFADEDGQAWPSVGTLAARCCLSERSANRAIAELEASGELERRIGAGPKGTNVYRVLAGSDAALDARSTPVTGVTPAIHVTPVTNDTLTPVTRGDDAGDLTPLTPVSPEPSLNHQERSVEPATPAERLPACPLGKLITMFIDRVPELPRPRTELWAGSSAEKDLQARWRWVLTAKRTTGERYATNANEALAWFGKFFDTVAASDFLSGRSGRWTNCNLQWLVTKKNFAKVVEGNFENDEREAA